ncbi:MAG: pentapeptide repeat-containing protein [bacterium]
MQDANLTNTNFSEAILSEADLDGALLVGTIFDDTEMPGNEIF